MPKTRGLAAAVIALLVLGAGCASIEPSSVEPGDGPASATPRTTEADPGGAATEDPAKDTADEEGAGDPGVASFGDKYVYADGLEIEVTKIRTETLSRYGSGDGKLKPGDDYVVMTIRVRNGSKAKLDIFGSAKITYGPDGDEAGSVYDSEKFSSDTPSGVLLPGKSKTGQYGFAIPKKYRDDVTLETSVDFEHEAAIFTGEL